MNAEARTKGTPALGSGRIFPVTEESITIAALPIARHWPQIGGLDFGWDHPTAAVKLAWDRDADIVYVIASYRLREATPLIHAGALKPWGEYTSLGLAARRVAARQDLRRATRGGLSQARA